MPDTLVAQLTNKVEQKRSLITLLTEQAAEKGADLNDADMATIEDAQQHIRKWNDQLEKLSIDLDLAEDARQRLSSAGRAGAITAPDFQYRSAGDLLWDVLHQTDSDAANRYRRVYRRAAEHMGTLAANTTPVAGDMAGLVVKAPVGPVINPYRTGMPLAAAIGMRPVEQSDGFGFSRPQIVDPGIDSGVGPQALEKAELPSKAFSITSTPVTLTTIGGYLNISQQLLSWAPSSLQIVLDQLRVRLERDVEATMLTAITNGSTAVPIGAAATGPEILQAIYDAAAAYFTATNMLPSWVAMGPLGWAKLGGLVDLAGRPLFPTLGASNAPGTASAASFATTVAGLTPVVTPAITDNSLFVGGGDAIEGYLYPFPVLEAVEPSVLGRQVAVAASIGTHQPPPFTDAIQHLTFA